MRVMLVDDHPIVRQGMQSVLANYPNIQVVGEADSAASLFAQLDALKPEVVVMDIRMPGQNGIETTLRLKREHLEIKVIILSTYDDDELVFGALRAGADAYLLKSSSHQVLASAIEQVGQGEQLLSPALVGKVMREFQLLAKDKSRIESGLTEQELAILRLIADGATNKEIAEKLFWSEVTVKRKVQDILEKIGVANRAQAVAEASKRGWL